MATYPAGVYAPRTKVNKDGVVYDAAKTKVLFAEDVVGLDGEVVAVEEKVGIGASTPTAGKVLTGTAVGESAWQDPAGASTEVLSLITTQINVSSIGDTYTDVVGNTYAETVNQTRITLTAIRIRRITSIWSGHVSVGTGTFQLYNFTDGVSLGTGTTTSTSEVKIAYASSTVAGNKGDQITIRVKNSVAGGTVTIDGGGMIDSDLIGVDTDTVVHRQFNYDFFYGGYPVSLSVGILRGLSTATFTAQLEYRIYTGAGSETVYNAFGSTFGTVNAQTVFSITPTLKGFFYSNNPTPIGFNIIATNGIAEGYGIGISYQLKLDNI